MKRNEAIAHRLKEVLLDGHWVANTNYKEQLANLSLAEATRKTGNLNTIAALIFHINYYLKGLTDVFDKGILEIKDKFSFDLPELRSEKDWEDLRNEFFKNAEAFISRIEQMPESKLDEPFIVEKYGTYLRNIEAMIEHCYYHLGQISLIRKLQTSG